jgi:hypothetical protein
MGSMGEGGRAIDAELVERALKGFIEWLNERIRLWLEYAEACRDAHIREVKGAYERAVAIRKALGYGEDDLLGDYYYDHECAERIAEELRRILRVIGGEHA